MNAMLKYTLAVASLAFAAHAAAQITFYEHEGFGGRSFTTQEQVGNFERFGFNDRASSVVVTGDRWEACEDARFGGRCVILRPGRYPTLASMGLNDRLSSVRSVSTDARNDDNRNVPAAPGSQVTFYENEGFGGRSFTTQEQIGNFENFGFNNRASSVVVLGERWEACEDARFGGRCVVLRPGRYPSLASMGLNDRVSSVRSVSTNARIDDNRYAPAPVAAQVTFYEREGFAGRSFTTQEQIANFERFGFNDSASSVVVLGERWEVCDDARFGGRCVVLRPGRYSSLASMGLNNRVSSVRAVSSSARIDDHRYAPAPVAGRDDRRRSDERVYEANVTSVRAVQAAPSQRCWMEREPVVQDRGNADNPAAIFGAILGGILGKEAQQAQTREVQRCENVPSQARPDHWDVIYTFRGQQYRMQMKSQPGATVLVNERGELAV